MTPTRPTLRLKPEVCDGCGKCVAACREAAIRVGPGFIFVDWERCDGCGRCVAVCEKGAIEDKAGGAPAPAPDDDAYSADPGWGESRLAHLRADGILVVPGEPASAGGPAVSAAPPPAALDDEGAPVVWDGIDAWVAPVTLILLALGLGIVLNLSPIRSLPASSFMAVRNLLLGVYYLIALGGLAGLAALRHKVSLVEALHLRRRPTPAAWGAVVGLVVLTWLFARAYQVTTQALGWLPPKNTGVEISFDAVGLFFAVTVVVLLGPLVEELLLRGVVLSAMRRRFSAWVAIVVTALVFAGLHASLWTFLPLTFLGLALGWVTVRFRSVWPAVALHAGYNAVLISAAFWVATRS